jgi:hypothetical protein
MATGLSNNPNRNPISYPQPNFNQSNMSMQSNGFRRGPDPPSRNMSVSAFNLNQMGMNQPQQMNVNGGWNGMPPPQQQQQHQPQLSQVIEPFENLKL